MVYPHQFARNRKDRIGLRIVFMIGVTMGRRAVIVNPETARLAEGKEAQNQAAVETSALCLWRIAHLNNDG